MLAGSSLGNRLACRGVTTFADVLAHRLRADPGQPLVTYYDLGTGERVELSVTTYANWVAKTASLLAEEHDLERGQSLRVDLPVHWLGPVFLGAAWAIGLTVSEDDVPDAVVCGPDSLARWASYADRLPVLACSLLPMGVRFADALPPGVHDVGVTSGRSRTPSRPGTRPRGRIPRSTGPAPRSPTTSCGAGPPPSRGRRPADHGSP